MVARRHGQGRGALAPWKCWKVFHALVFTVKRSVDQLFMHYCQIYRRLLGASSTDPHQGSTLDPTKRSSFPDPLIFPPLEKNPASAQVMHIALKTAEKRNEHSSDFLMKTTKPSLTTHYLARHGLGRRWTVEPMEKAWKDVCFKSLDMEEWKEWAAPWTTELLSIFICSIRNHRAQQREKTVEHDGQG